MRARVLVLLCLLAACGRAPRPEATARAHVYLVIVDGLGARFATRERMPALFATLAHEPERSTFFPDALGVMPARTNPNHVTLLTGVHADVHGIVGNAFWSRARGTGPEKLDAAERIEVETLYTVAETTDPSFVTLGAFAKPKLARLFGAVPGRQRAPDVLWSPERLPARRRDPATGYAPDAETVRAALDAVAGEPDLAVLNLSDVDRAGHAHGPDSPEYAAAIRGADAAIGVLVDELHRRGRWSRTVLIVTADHGMTAVAPTPERPRPLVSLGAALRAAGVDGVTVVADGGVDHVYVTPVDAVVGRAREPTMERARRAAARVPGVAEVARVGADHPDWHVDDQRAGDLLAIAVPGYQFVDPPDTVEAALLGNHGGPQDRHVPLIVTGGWPGLQAAPPGTASPELVDVAPTVAALLGLRRPRRVDGSALPDDALGRPIAAVLGQSPH